jgi:hypothetical protein
MSKLITKQEMSFQRGEKFDGVTSELANVYIEMLSHELCHCVNASIHYTIVHKDERKELTVEEFASIPREFQAEYNLKLDCVPFFNSSTMIAETNHLERKRIELSKICPNATIESTIELYAINKLDVVRVSLSEKHSRGQRYSLSYLNQKEDKELIADNEHELVRSICIHAIQMIKECA